MDEANRLIELIQGKAKMVAMLAPSFPVVFQYPQIITKLKKLGFTYVVEVSAGANITNQQVLKLLQENPQSRFITSPCPSFVRMVRAKYPQLSKYLAFQADSPMIATAKVVKEKCPGFVPVFIGPCIAKKLEASEDYPDLGVLVVTYKELEETFEHFNVEDSSSTNDDHFDWEGKTTRIYPTDGGLTLSAGLDKILKKEEYRIVSGWQNIEKALEEFSSNPYIRFMDVLFCEGGCISGPGIKSTLTTEERKKKVIDYVQSVSVTQAK